MKYKETGFRALYHHFCAFELTDKIRPALKNFPGAKSANCVLVYGYIDREAGLTLEVLAAAKKTNDGFAFADTSSATRFFIRVGAVEDVEFYYFNDSDNALRNRYSEKIDMLSDYDADEQVEESRKMEFLDECRHPEYPDDIQVYLTKDGLNPEACWTRIIGLGDHWIMGKLLNEPYQDFGYHSGEEIAFFVQQDENNKVICFSNMNPSQKLKAEDLEDGSMLKEAIEVFEGERTEPHFIDIMEILRDSYVWIPCNAVMGEADQKAIEELVKKSKDNLNELIGVQMSTSENIRMIPDILQNGDDFFFPAFITCEDMGEYGDNFSKVQKHFLEAISLARNNDKNVKGIVLNAFSQPFVVDREIWDLIENMKSRIS